MTSQKNKEWNSNRGGERSHDAGVLSGPRHRDRFAAARLALVSAEASASLVLGLPFGILGFLLDMAARENLLAAGGVLGAKKAEGLAAARLTIAEEAAVVPVQRGLHQLLAQALALARRSTGRGES